MAVAGKVAITLDNEESWRADKQYDKLVAVQYQGDMYISKKASVGVEPTNTEYWFLSVTGTEVNAMTSETMGIGRPDNDTITVANGVFKAEINKELLDKLGESDEGTLTFGGSEIKTSTDYVAETVDDAQAAVDSGNVDDGATIYVKEDSDSAVIVDSELSETSKNPVQNKVIDAKLKEIDEELERIRALRASFEQYGLVKLTNSAAVTDSTGMALSATEKNATIPGTLANQISSLNTDYFANNVHAKSIAIAPNIVGDIAEIMLCAQNGNGKVNRLVSNTNLPYVIGAYHSTDYGQSWDGFSVGTVSGNEKVNGFYACASNNADDDNRVMYIRFINRHGRLLDLHINFYPNASPKLSAFAQNDAGGLDLVWTLG